MEERANLRKFEWPIMNLNIRKKFEEIERPGGEKPDVEELEAVGKTGVVGGAGAGNEIQEEEEQEERTQEQES